MTSNGMTFKKVRDALEGKQLGPLKTSHTNAQKDIDYGCFHNHDFSVVTPTATLLTCMI